jgi:23S rRNA pseudouridine955/2504/2580 synthase/23S rRNA pseudouridine1911/1915/1917 synthase
MKERILTEDEHLVAVKKLSGELVVADRWGVEKNVLLHRLGEYLRAEGHTPDASGRDLYPVHRLDRETSGVVLFAKHQEAHRLLSKMFEHREMRKTYWAFTAGVPEWDACVCSIPLSRAEGKKGRGSALIDLKRGKPAETEFLLKERFGDISWMEARPRTGRLHQIRVHLRALGVPILWDEAYWDSQWKSASFPQLLPRTLPLHARTLAFLHPYTKKEITIECPMEESMRDLLNELKRGSGSAPELG